MPRIAVPVGLLLLLLLSPFVDRLERILRGNLAKKRLEAELEAQRAHWAAQGGEDDLDGVPLGGGYRWGGYRWGGY